VTAARSASIAIGALALGAAFVFGFAHHPLLEPDEGRNAEVAREMAASGGYVVPRLDGLPYIDKPVFYFAVAALSIKALGATALAARLPSLVATVLTLALVGWFARRRYGGLGAWTAVMATGAAPLTIAFARTVIFDSTLTLFVTAAIVAWVEGVNGGDSRQGGDSGDSRSLATWVWCTMGWAAVGLGILTKGPIALALPLLVALPYAFWRQQWRAILDPVGILLCIAIVAPWVMAMSARIPGYLNYVLVVETARRLTTSELGRAGPVWYFMPILVAGALPWSLVVLAGARSIMHAARERDPDTILLLLWILVPLVFFSLSQSKRPQYVLPLIPAVALLVARLWRDCPDRLSGVRIAGGALGVMGLVLAVMQGSIAHAFGASAAVTATIPQAAWVLASCCAIGATVALVLPARRGAVVLALAFPVTAIPFAGRGVIDQIAHERSSADLARAIQPVLRPATRVVAAGTFPLSLPYYLERPVLLASGDARELTSNYLVRSPAARYGDATPLRPAEWWREAIVACDPKVIVVVRQNDQARRAVLEAKLPLLIETPRYAAYGPCGRTDLAAAGADGTRF
jgi:4-amino-4-deoxy-L-arabinose transferase-like glycosyltransferase